jgi:hypothetical protein
MIERRGHHRLLNPNCFIDYQSVVSTNTIIVHFFVANLSLLYPIFLNSYTLRHK